MGAKKKRIGLYVLAILIAGVAAFLFLMLGPPKLLAKSESPLFCAGCHVMEAEYDAWAHTGAHRREQCVDCHLPNQNVTLHYTWKAIDGLKDTLVFYSGKVPERIMITAQRPGGGPAQLHQVSRNHSAAHRPTAPLLDMPSTHRPPGERFDSNTVK
jgi:cytochrome c nitrite reductase small subunit